MTDTLPPQLSDELLERLARQLGVDRDYRDLYGQNHTASRECLTAIFASLGLDARSPDKLRQSALAYEARQWRDGLASVHVIPVADAPLTEGETSPRALTLRVLQSCLGEGRLAVTITLEDATRNTYTVRLNTLSAGATQTVDGIAYCELALHVPDGLPLGYHELDAVLEAPGQSQARFHTRLIVAPERAWLPPALDNGGRLAALAVSLFGLRSERNWGIGDFTDLARLARWASTELGVSMIGLNPLHALHNREPYNISPYLPLSTYFRNPIYLDVTAVEDYALCPRAQRLVQSDEFQSELAGLRNAEQVRYEAVARMKRGVLKLLFRRFLRDEWKPQTARAARFAEWRKAQGELLTRFSTYCALDETLHERDRKVWIWQDWPEAYRTPDSKAVREFAAHYWRRLLYHEWLQWQIDLQLAAAQSHAHAAGLLVGLYHDLALATDRCGADLWAHPSFYASGCRVGSPPDGFAPEGQDWAFPPPNSAAHRADGYRLFAESIRRNARHGGALRIDHFMRFFRLFWIPDGVPAKDGTYVNERWRDLLRILALESQRGQFLVVGEDLGTVPSELRAAMEHHGILSYRLLYFERSFEGTPKRPHEYPRQALVSSTTHDLPTLAGYWAATDIEARRAAGLAGDHANYRRQLEERINDKRRLLEALIDQELLPNEFPRQAAEWTELTGELHNAIIGYLASTPSMLMLLNQEDLTKETDQQNLPGTTWEYPNWKRKMRFSLEDLESNPHAGDFARMFRYWLAKSGRLNSPRI